MAVDEYTGAMPGSRTPVHRERRSFSDFRPRDRPREWPVGSPDRIAGDRRRIVRFARDFIFLDGHSHLHGEVPSFFYIHHYIFYAGYLATYGWIVLSMLAGYLRSGDWMVPPGYRLAIYGGVVFGLGGGLDMLWHAAFGFEASTEALLGPTHLLLVSYVYTV